MSQIKWTNAAGGDFATATNWSTGTVPGAGDDAIFMLAGPYTVTSGQSETVNSVQMVQGITLSVTGGTFDASKGSGSGTDNGLIAVGNNTEFQAGGTIAGTGTLQVNSVGNGTYLTVLDSGLTLSGGGKVVLSDNSQNYLRALNAGDTLTNVNDTISGAGQFAYNNMSFSNGAAGVLNANAAGNALEINAGSGTIGNAGLFEATAAGGLDIFKSSITQTGTGTLKAVGSGNNISLDGGSVTGGTLTTTGGGLIQSVSDGYLTNVTVSTGSTVAALNNTFLHINGTITNKGTIAVDSGGNGTRLQIDSGTLTLTGAGAVVLTDNSQNFLYAGNQGNLLINLNNTISGAGQLTYNNLAFDNRAAGVIDATGTSNALVVDTGGAAFSNEGLLEDTGAGGLAITDSTVVVNTGTILAAGAGSHVDLNTGSIQGGVLKTTGGGVIQSVNNFTLDGSTAKGAITITANSQIAVLNNTYLTLAGSIVNDSTIALDSAGNGTRLQINGTVSLTGGGSVLLTDNSQNYLYSVNQTDMLVNVNNTIAGAGQLTNNRLAFDNQAAGVIDATGTSNALVVDTGNAAFSNEGLLEDTGAGGLAIIDATVIANKGTILAAGSGSHIDLNTGSIQGGVLKTTGGGVIQSVNNFELDGSTRLGAITIAAHSQLAVLNNQYLTLAGSIVNGGTIALDSVGNGTRLQINGTVTLSGGGSVLLSDSTQNYLYSANQNDTLLNVDNTISGSGSLGINFLNITNMIGGTIDSTSTSGIAVDNGAKAFINQGLVEDTGTGGFTLLDGTVIANSGTVLATGAGSTVDLYSGTIQGGTVATSNGGSIQVTDFGTLDGLTSGKLTLAAGTQVAVQNSNYLTLDGTIVNGGTIALDSVGNGTRLQINNTVSLTGGGTVLLSDSTQNYLYSVNQTDKLVNVNNTISGSGQLGINFLAMDNQAAGVINSSGTAGMTVDTGGRAFTNEGLIEDTGTGGFTLVDGTVIANTGTILATGTGSSIVLYAGTIQGGTVATTNGGSIQVPNLGTLDGATAGTLTIATASQVVVQNSEYLTLDGTIANAGTIALDSVGNGTRLQINGTVTLTGGGSVLLSDNAQNYLYSVNQTDTLVNVNNTISGSGQFASNDLSIDNQAAGVIDSTGAAGILIDSGNHTVTNEGTIEAAGSGGLVIQSTTLTNTGTIAALSDSSVTIASTVALTNLNAGGTLTGGTYEAIAASGTHTATLALNAPGNIVTDAGTIVLSGAGSSITNNGTAVETTLTTVAAHGTLELLNGRADVNSFAFSDSGAIVLTGTFAQSSLSIAATGSVNASGGAGTLTISGAITDRGVIEASNNGSLLITSGNLTNTGTVQALAGSTLTLGSGVKNTNLSADGTLTGGTWAAIGGTLALGGRIIVDAATLTLSGTGSAITGLAGKSLETTLTTVAAGAQLNVLAGRQFIDIATGGVVDSGTITLGGGAFGDQSLTIAASGSFAGAGTFRTAVTDNGLVDSRVVSGFATLVASGAIAGTGSILAETGSTLNAQAGFNVASVTVQSGATVQGAGTATGAIAVAGTLSLAGGSLKAQTLSTTATGVISGAGTIATAVTNAGTIQATGGTLTLAAGESGGVLQAVGTGGVGGALVSLAAVSATALTIDKPSSFTGFGSVSGPVTDGGSLVASGALNLGGSLSGAGSATIDAGARLTVGGLLTLTGGLSFAAGSETLALGTPAGDTTVLSGFANGDTIDLVNTPATFLSYNTTKDRLTIKNMGTTVSTLKFSGTYTAANFSLKSDGHGGENVIFKASPALADLQQAAAGASLASFATAPAAAGTHVAPAPAGWAPAAQPSIGDHMAAVLAHQS